MLFQEISAAVMVTENTMDLRFVLLDTSYDLVEDKKCQGNRKRHSTKGKKGQKRNGNAERRLEFGGRGLKR